MFGCYFKEGRFYLIGFIEELRKLYDKICIWKDDLSSSSVDRCEGSQIGEREICKEVIIVVLVIVGESLCKWRRDLFERW